jgi:hypothetical protein
MTEFQTMDIDSNFNIIVGGSTVARELVANANNQKGLLIYYEESKFLKWAKYLDDDRRRQMLISTVKFTKSGHKVLVGLTSSYLHLIEVDSESGEMIKSWKETGHSINGFIQNTGISVDINDNVFMAVNRKIWEV